MVGNPEAFRKAMEQGHTAAWEKQWERASGFYRMALEEIPDEPLALNSLGMALVEMNQYNEALVCYQRAVVVNPQDPLPVERVAWISEKQGKALGAMKAYLQAAELHLKNRDLDKAIETWKKVCGFQPDNLQARTRMALILERTGKKTEAVREYLIVAGWLQKNGDIAKAFQVVEYCLQIVPGHNEARLALTKLRTNQPLPKPNRPAGGTTPLSPKEVPLLAAPVQSERKTADPIQEARQTALSQLADMLFNTDDETLSPPPGAPNRLGAGVIAPGSGGKSISAPDWARISVHLGQAIEMETQGEEQQAAQNLERAVELGLDHPAADYNLGDLFSRREPKKALKYLQKSVNKPEFNLACLLLMGQIHLAENRLSQAVTAFLQALCLADTTTSNPNMAEELRKLYEPVIIGQSQNKNPAILKAVCETITKQLIQPDWRTYLRNIRQQVPAQPEGSPPVPLVEIMLETGNSQVVEALVHIRQLAAEKKTSTAIEEIFYTLQYAPTYLPLHIQLGDILAQEGRSQDAVEKFMLVAELYNLRGEPGQAIRLLKRVIKLAPMDLSVRSRLIGILTDQNQIEDAIQQYNEMADIYYRLTDLDMARQTYAAALRLVQKSKDYPNWAIKILYKVADIDLQRLDLRQALRIFEQIRILAPEDMNARVNLVIQNYRLGQNTSGEAEADDYATLLENSGKRSKAIEFLITLIGEQPDRFELRKRLADTFLRDGQIIAAVEQLDHIADAYLNAGDQIEAVGVLEMIVNLNPPNVEGYRRALEQMR